MASMELTRETKEAAMDERTSEHESTVNIACVQFEPNVGELVENRKRSCQLIEDAIERGGDFIVLPELANSGYVFNSREEAYSLSELVPSGETTQQWVDLACEHEVYIIGGCAERDGNTLYNSAILVGPDGHIGTHRKLHLWNQEKLWFEPGDTIEVFNTKIGRVGMQVCYDQWFPELTRIQVQMGADIIAEPTNWVPSNEKERSGLNEEQLARANHLAISNAHVNAVWFACADRVGTERDQPFLGRSIIVDPTGTPIVGPASQDDEELLLAEGCNLMDARTQKTLNELNVIPHDRRTDLYDELLGYESNSHPF